MSTCPSIHELTATAAPSPGLAAHLADCPRCRGLRAAWEADSLPDERFGADDVPAVEWPHPPHPQPDADPAPGAVHSIWGPETGELLVAGVIEVDEREALVVPLSIEFELAGDWDVLLAPGTLPYRAMLEVWNHLHVLREQLMEQVAQLEDGWVDLLTEAYTNFMAGEEFPPQLDQGPALLTEADPRHAFRDAEAARSRDFAEPWRILFSAASLGAVLRGRREERAIELSELSEEVDIPSLGRIEEDSEDLWAEVPLSNFEHLVERIGLPASARLGDLVGQAVYDNARQAPPEIEATLARRRRGMRSAASSVPDEVRQRMADEYVSRLLARLSGER
jgi:hypothetical protein